MKRDLKFLYATIAIIGLIAYLSVFYNFQGVFLMISVLVLSVVFIAIGGMFLQKCFSWYAFYMLMGKNTFQPKVDRPRVFLHTLLLPLSLLIIWILNNFERSWSSKGSQNNVILEFVLPFVLISLLLVIMFLLFKTWGKSFESLYLPTVQKIVRSYTADFKCYASVDKLQKVYDGLINYDFLWFDDLNEQNEIRKRFVETFVTGNFPSEPLFQLKMDNLQTHVLFENLEKDTKGLSLDGFMKIVKNKNPKASAESIVESYRKCISENIKNRNLIEMIF